MGDGGNAGMGEEEIGRTMSPGTLMHRNVAHSPFRPFALSAFCLDFEADLTDDAC